MNRRWLLVAAGLALGAAALYLVGIARNWHGEPETAGQALARPAAPGALAARERAQRAAAQAAGVTQPRQILFGDLHVHTTFSSDAFRMSLPMVQGDGAHPPADACDFARACSGLDFWALTDHAESLTAERWRASIDSVRQCNALAGAGADPDLVTFMGFEWTQAGATPETHYGHKNVIFAGDGPDDLPLRPIGSDFREAFGSIPLRLRLLPPLRDLGERQRYYDFSALIASIGAQPLCPPDVPVRELPADCAEVAPTPEVLFRKLDEWGLDALVIPHGTAWGIYSPAGTAWDKQLAGAMHDPQRQRLIEVFSGHGNSEEHRAWRAVRHQPDGEAYCPSPLPDYLPSCWRAGELIRARCLAAGEDAAECDQRAATARRQYLAYGQVGWHTVPGTRLEDWLDAGQCRDCFLPAFNYRPGGSVQYALAIGNFDGGEGPPARFRFGLLASSDNHSARPGTGYKQYARRPMVDWWGYRDAGSRALYATDRGEPAPASVAVDVSRIDLFNILELERQASYFVTGGLVAVHAAGRDREAVWQALKRREVYGTTGQRTLLWFDLLAPAAGDTPHPMGSEVALTANPRFRAVALGALRQLPGCPADSLGALPAERLERLCRGECYHPSSERVPIRRIEVVRIRPQARPGEPVAPLVEDPWRRFDCEGPPQAGCAVEFEDPEFAAAGRDTVYYVRAVEAATPMINAGGLRCETDAEGRCIGVDPCYGDDRSGDDDLCLAEAEPRAWSSPIFIDHAGPVGALR